MNTQSNVAVFTTPERCDLFRAAIGTDADFRMNPFESIPLDTTLENLFVGGARIAVFDESHFVEIRQLAYGLATYMDKPGNRGRLLRSVLVCPERMAGDEWLKYFTGYLGIYDIAYGVQGVETVDAVHRLLTHPNERLDIIPLLDHAAPWEEEAPDAHVLEPQPTVGQCAVEQDGLKVQIQVNIVPA